MTDYTNDPRRGSMAHPMDADERERANRTGSEPRTDDIRRQPLSDQDEQVETADPAMKDQPAEGGVDEAEPQRSWKDRQGR